jgi:hypothetical protein
MAGFGRFNPWPFQFGGGKRPIEVIHEALVDAYSPVLDMSQDTFADIEAHAEATVLAGTWVAGARLRNQAVPATMVEALPEWEQITKLRPAADDSDDDRRAELAGKIRGLFNNAEPDISEACAEVLGSNFVACHYVSESEAMTYWPGMAPGPATQPWSSARCIVLVEATKGALSSDAYSRKVGRLERLLDDMLPAWMTFCVFRHDELSGVAGFYLDESMLDEVGL